MAETVPLREYIEKLIKAADKRYQQRFDATEEAIRKAETATEKRLEGMNEFRNTLTDQARDFLPRAEYQLGRDTNIERISRIESRLDNMDGTKKGVMQSWGILIGAITIAAAIGAILGKHF